MHKINMYYCNLAPHTFVIAIQLYFFLIARSCCSFAHSWCANKYSAVPPLLLLHVAAALQATGRMKILSCILYVNTYAQVLYIT